MIWFVSAKCLLIGLKSGQIKRATRSGKNRMGGQVGSDYAFSSVVIKCQVIGAKFWAIRKSWLKSDF